MLDSKEKPVISHEQILDTKAKQWYHKQILDTKAKPEVSQTNVKYQGKTSDITSKC